MDRTLPIFPIWLGCLLSCELFTRHVLCGWEYSVRRYLEGFSDAVVPATATPELKIEAILNWMKHGPARQAGGPSTLVPDRDPVETLNYESLLRVCGSATNAFINLADSGGLEARRLLLLGSDGQTRHVVAEVFVNERWIVVDPTFHHIFRGADGDYLTRSQLANPTVFAAVTRSISNYEPSYTFERTAHVHMTQISYVGAGIVAYLAALRRPGTKLRPQPYSSRDSRSPQ